MITHNDDEISIFSLLVCAIPLDAHVILSYSCGYKRETGGREGNFAGLGQGQVRIENSLVSLGGFFALK